MKQENTLRQYFLNISIFFPFLKTDRKIPKTRYPPCYSFRYQSAHNWLFCYTPPPSSSWKTVRPFEIQIFQPIITQVVDYRPISEFKVKKIYNLLISFANSYSYLSVYRLPVTYDTRLGNLHLADTPACNKFFSFFFFHSLKTVIFFYGPICCWDELTKRLL